MRVLELDVRNIGPFREAHLEFLSEPEELPPVALITGENGTGKSIILDAIRARHGEQLCARRCGRYGSSSRSSRHCDLHGTRPERSPWRSHEVNLTDRRAGRVRSARARPA